MTYENEIYHLSIELLGHEKCVRCICVLKDNTIATGGLDNQIIIWKEVKENIWKEQEHLRHHEKYVLVLESSNTLANSRSDLVTFYSGGIDQIIYRVSTKQEIISRFEGHTSAVCSLLEIPKLEILISGSWDSSVRIWDLNSSNCRHILSGHAYAVTLEVTPLINNENIYLISGSQNKALFLWSIPTGRLVKTISNSHDDIIRSISVSKTKFQEYKLLAATVSNDCKIKLWELDLRPGKENIILKTTKVHHNSFIFDVLFSKHHVKRIFTASDDCTVAVWKVSENFELNLEQKILFCATVWNIKEMNHNDFLITASEDAVCRIWSTNRSNEKVNIFRTQNASQYIKSTSSEDQKSDQECINVFEDIPDISQIKSYSSEKNGTVKLFRNKDQIKAYEWNGSNWSLSATANNHNSKSKINYSGDSHFPSGSYDYLFDIDIGEKTSLKKLPYNLGDNPLISAEKFCEREDISKNYCATICNFIEENVPNISNRIEIENFSDSINQFKPCSEYKLFKNVNIDGLISRIKKEYPKLTNKARKDTVTVTNDELCLLEVDIEHLNDLFNRIKTEVSKNPNFSIKIQMKSVELDIIYRKMSKWLGITDIALPIVDLWRILALHPQSSDIHKKSDQGWWLLMSVLKLINSISLDILNDSVPTDNNQLRSTILLICLRFFCNMFCNTTNREVMICRQNEILFSIKTSMNPIIKQNFNLSTKKNVNENVILSLLALILNYTIAFNYRCCDFFENRNLLLSLVTELIPIICGNYVTNNPNELIYYQLLILSNNYYYFAKYNNLSNLYIVEENLLDKISNFVSKQNSSEYLVATKKLLDFIKILKNNFQIYMEK